MPIQKVWELIDAHTKKSGNLLMPIQKVWELIDAITKSLGTY